MREALMVRMGIDEARCIYEHIRHEEEFLSFSRYLHDHNLHVARNAAWVMTQGSNEEVSWLQPKQDELIDLVLTTDNASLRRLVLNLLERLTYRPEDLRSDFLDFCLEHMQSLLEPPGVQSLCMKLAYKQCLLYPELKEELMRTLQAIEISYYSPGLRCVLQRILSGKCV